MAAVDAVAVVLLLFVVVFVFVVVIVGTIVCPTCICGINSFKLDRMTTSLSMYKTVSGGDDIDDDTDEDCLLLSSAATATSTSLGNGKMSCANIR